MSASSPSRFLSLPDSVQWFEGMLLSPQHFQQSEQCSQAMNSARLAALQPDFWGLNHLELDGDIAQGQLRIKRVHCVLPDGLPVLFDRQHRSKKLAEMPEAKDCLSLDLNKDVQIPTDGKPLRIWLGAARRSADAARQDSNFNRYISYAGDDVNDENTGGNPIYLPRQSVNLKLIHDPALLPRYDAFPLLEVRRNVDGHIELADYLPPLLNLGASATWGERGLLARLKFLSDTLWKKLRELSALCDEEGTASHVQRYLFQARQLGSVLPFFDALAASASTHPRAAYLAVVNLVGQASTLGGNPLPPATAAYQHEDCLPQFQSAIDFINRRLSLIDTKLERLPFSDMGETGFGRRLGLEDKLDELIIELRPKAGQSEDSLHRWLDNARIASDDLLQELRRRRLPGARVIPISRAERKAMDLKEQAILFRIRNDQIEVNGQTQGCFRGGRPLIIQGEADPQAMPAAIILYRWKDGPPSLQAGEEALSPLVAASALGEGD